MIMALWGQVINVNTLPFMWHRMLPAMNHRQIAYKYKYTVSPRLLVSANTEFLCDVFFQICKHSSPCDVITSRHHVAINCNSMRFTVHKLSISENRPCRSHMCATDTNKPAILDKISLGCSFQWRLTFTVIMYRYFPWFCSLNCRNFSICSKSKNNRFAVLFCFPTFCFVAKFTSRGSASNIPSAIDCVSAELT